MPQTKLDLMASVAVVRLTSADAKRTSDSLRDFQRTVLASEPFYPGIGRWLKERVFPELGSGRRSAFLAYDNGRPIIAAILKRGPKAKFCHLRIADEFQNLQLGELFFALMGVEVWGLADEIHFTLPESLWELRQGFFRSFGFSKSEPAGKQYRLFDRELHCATRFDTFWRHVLDKLPRLRGTFALNGSELDAAIVMSLRPRAAAALMNGTKSVEIRRRFSKRWVGSRAAVYATEPLGRLVGRVRIDAVVEGTIEEIWSRFGAQMACSRSEFNAYASGAATLFAIQVGDVENLGEWPSTGRPRDLVGSRLRAPESYCRVGAGGGWDAAVPLAVMSSLYLGTPTNLEVTSGQIMEALRYIKKAGA